MRKITAVIAFFLWSLLNTAWAAADISVSLRLDRVEATLVDTVRMEIHVSGTRSSDARPVLHGMESFLVTKGGTSSRIEIVNGKVNAGLTYTYFIQPQKTGEFTLGPAEIKADGRILESNKVKLVVKASSPTSEPDRSPVFIEASISKQDIFVEEQTLYILKFYYRINVGNLSLNMPEIENIALKQLGEPREYQTTNSGAAFRVLEIRYSLSASVHGEYVIGPSKMKMIVRKRGNQSLFDDFFNDPFFQSPFSSFSSGRPLTVASQPVELKVLALPEVERPSDFSGLVGKYQMESRLEPAHLKTGESATLTVKVSGKGNVNRIPDIDLPELAFARTYSDQPVLETDPGDDGITGTKTMKWALVPGKAGQFKVPPLKLSFFNPESRKYDELHTATHTLSVLPGPAQETAAANLMPSNSITAEKSAKKEIQQLGMDILPIHTSAGDLSVPYRMLFTGWLYWFVLFGPPVIYLMLLGGMKIRNRSPERMVHSRSRNAFRNLSKRCRQDLSGGADLIEAFRDYLNERFNLAIGTLTAAETEKILLSNGADSDTAIAMRSLIERLENAVYAGDDAQPADAVNDLLGFIKTLEKEIQ